MAITLYTPGKSNARSLINDGKYDNTSPWSFSAEDGDALLGPGKDDWTNFGKFHLGEDTSATEDTKGRFSFPHGKDGKVYGGALRAIRNRAADNKAIFHASGELLDLIKAKEGTSDDRRRGARAEEEGELPPYDPDGDGDNDAEEALNAIRAAGILMDHADDCLTGEGDGDDAMARVIHLMTPRSRRVSGENSSIVLPFKRPTARSVLRVRAQANGETAEMDLFGVVGGDFWSDGGITKEQFADQLRQIPASAKRVDLRLSSPGGDVFEGRAIANMMAEHPAAFDVNVIAEASSVASIIAMAGDTIRMGEGAVMLIHRCYSFCIGNSVELTAIARDLATIDETMVQTYAKRTGMKPADITALMDENRYMSAEEAKSRGFADSIGVPPVAAQLMKIAALDIDRARFHLPPLPTSMRPRRAAALAALSRIRQVVKTA